MSQCVKHSKLYNVRFDITIIPHLPIKYIYGAHEYLYIYLNIITLVMFMYEQVNLQWLIICSHYVCTLYLMRAKLGLLDCMTS